MTNDVKTQRDERQATVAKWCAEAFGQDHASSLPQRGLRLLEEALEAAQAAGVPLAQAHHVVDYVYGRPVGELQQELGGIGVTVLALAAAAGLSAEEAEAREVARVLSKPIEHFRRRNIEKNEAGLEARPDAATRLNAEAEMLNKLVITLRETRQRDAAKIAKLKKALEAGPARLREMADDYDRKLLLHDFSKARSSEMAALIRSADLINAALHVEAAQEKAMEP